MGSKMLWRCLIFVLLYLVEEINASVDYHRASYPPQNSNVTCPRKCLCSVEGTQTCVITCEKNFNLTHLGLYFQSISSFITQLHFRDSELRSIPQEVCVLDKLEVLDLTNNYINHLGTRLSCFKNLTQVVLDHNSLRIIGDSDFQGLMNLQEISLRYNLLTFANPHAFTRSELVHLTRINLEYNLITQVDLWPFRMPAFQRGVLTFVNVTFNQLQVLINSLNVSITEIDTSKFLVADMRRNKFRYFRHLDFIKLLGVQQVTELMRLWSCGFDFHYNPWVCDCDMYQIMKYIRPILKKFVNMNDLYYIKVSCNKRLMTELPDDLFVCEVSQSCPTNCTCLHRPGNHTMQVDCRRRRAIKSLPDKLPQEQHIFLDLAETTITSLGPRPYLSNVTSLDLSQSKLTSLSYDVVEQLVNVTSLKLNSNDLKGLPQKMSYMTFPNLEEFSLWENPIVCDCSALWIKHWLLDHAHAVDRLGKTLCKGEDRSLTETPDSHFRCGFRHDFILKMYFVGISVVILIMSAFYLVTVFHVSLKVRLLHIFNRSMAALASGGNNPENDRLTFSNDIAIVYSTSCDDDEVLARRLERVIKSLPGQYKVKLVHRDNSFNKHPGTGASDIIHCSQTILFLMCEHLLQDRLSCNLFDEAYDLYMVDQCRCIVPLILGNYHDLLALSSGERLIHNFLEHYTCVQYTQEVNVLKRRLRDVLPPSCSARD